jgi:uncharacterized protein
LGGSILPWDGCVDTIAERPIHSGAEVDHHRSFLEASLDEPDRRREDEWFRANEKHLLEVARDARLKREEERAGREQAEERKRLRDLHYMKCPKCGHDMAEEDLEGVKVDRCSFCEGIYLDAGELDTIFLKKDEERKGFFRRLVRI